MLYSIEGQKKGLGKSLSKSNELVVCDSDAEALQFDDTMDNGDGM